MTVEHFLTNVVFPTSLIAIILFYHIRRIDKTHSKNRRTPSRELQLLRPILKPHYRDPITPAEKVISDAGYLIGDGPDRWSISIWKSMMDNKNAAMSVAHYWPKSQWWNLIGRKEKGRGLNKMLEVLGNGN